MSLVAKVTRAGSDLTGGDADPRARIAREIAAIEARVAETAGRRRSATDDLAAAQAARAAALAAEADAGEWRRTREAVLDAEDALRALDAIEGTLRQRLDELKAALRRIAVTGFAEQWHAQAFRVADGLRAAHAEVAALLTIVDAAQRAGFSHDMTAFVVPPPGAPIIAGIVPHLDRWQAAIARCGAAVAALRRADNAGAVTAIATVPATPKCKSAASPAKEAK